ncbi:MAG: HEAT repeat domain-containing protein, partial [Candidatus Acidiferrum sp.]
ELEKTTIQVGERSVSAHMMSGQLRADQVLKTPDTNLTPLLTFHFVVPDEFIGWRSITPGSYGIFFLAGPASDLRLASPFHPFVVAIPGAEAQEGTTIERIIAQLGAVLESQGSSSEEKEEAIFTLSKTQSPAAVQVLNRAEQEVQDPRTRLSIAVSLLEHNDISTLPLAAAALLNPGPTIPADLLHNLCYAILIGVKNEKAVPVLTKLLRAGNVETRRAAASALTHTGSTSAIDALISGIDDPDVMVQYYCVVGLADITGQPDWRPNISDFTSTPSKSVKHWHEWRLDHP